VSLDDDVFQVVKNYAETRSVAMAKHSRTRPSRPRRAVKTRVINGLVVFDLPEGSELITSERVKELAEEW